METPAGAGSSTEKPKGNPKLTVDAEIS